MIRISDFGVCVTGRSERVLRQEVDIQHLIEERA
jgi:hypothetical protein